MFLGKVVRVIENYGFIYVIQGEHTGKRLYFNQTDEPFRVHNIVRFNIIRNDKDQLQAEDLKLFEFKSFTEENRVLDRMFNVLGIVESYDPKAGWGFIELQMDDGSVEKQFVHHTAIETKYNCYKKLQRYEAVYVDISVVDDGIHGGKSRCSRVRSVTSKLRCEFRRKRDALHPDFIVDVETESKDSV